MKTQNKMPHQFTTLAEHFKTKYHVFFFSQKMEKTYVITLEVYNVKPLEVYNVKALEVSVLLLNTRGVHLCIIYSSIRDTLCMRHNSH